MIYSLASAFGEAIMDRFLGRGFSFALSLRSTTSLEANLHVERQEADVALVNSAYSSNTVCITPLAKEKMVLVVSKNSDYPEFVPLRELSIRDEVFLGWGNDFDVWHDFNIGAPEQAFLRADSFMYLDAPMKLWNKWTLMPFSLAQTLYARGDTRTCETDLVLPDRIIYLSRPARPKQPYFDAFEEDVRAVLRASKGLALL